MQKLFKKINIILSTFWLFCLSLPIVLMLSRSLCLSLNAQEGDVQRQAGLFFDAGDYGQAVRQYKIMLESSLSPWQQAIIAYNLGTAKLAQGKWEEALQSFQSIDTAETTLPLLKYRLQINMALARLLIFKEKFEVIQKNPDPSIKDYSPVVQLLQEAATEIAKIEKNRCQLLKAEGNSSCDNSIQTKEMQAEIKRLQEGILQKIHELMLSQEGSSALAGRSINEILQGILIQYTLTLISDPLTDLIINSLIEFQHILEAPLKQFDDDEINKSFKASQDSLATAFDLVQQGQAIKAKIYIEEAKHQIKLISHYLDKTANSPKKILQQMIESQEDALSLNRLRSNLEELETPGRNIDGFVQQAQSEALLPSENFYQAVVAQQKKDSQPLKDDNKVQNSQIAWDEVLTSFEAGVKSARQVEKTLVSSSHQQDLIAIQLQEKTLAAWKDALTKMQKKKKSDIKQQEEQRSLEQESAENKKQPESQEPEKTKMDEPRGSSLNDVLRSLQEMENDDRSQPYFKAPSNKDTQRPW